MSRMRTIIEQTPQSSGMALGGLGTGSVEIHPSGRLVNWQIFNRGEWASRSPEQDGAADLPLPQGETLSFYLRACPQGQEPVVRKLSHDDGDRRGAFRSAMYSWLKTVREIAWTPDFPTARLEYQDETLPLQISAEYLSPFVPHNSRVSGTPAFAVCFTLENTGSLPVEASLMGILQNPVCRGMAQRQLRNTVACEEGCTTLTMASDSPEQTAQNGSVSLAALDGEQTFLRGDFGAFLKAYVLGNRFGITEESCLFDFYEKGRLGNLGWESCPDLSRFTSKAIETMPEEEIDAWLKLILQSPSGERPWRRLCALSPSPVEDIQGKRDFLALLAQQYQRFDQPEYEAACAWGDGALCSTVQLQPGQRQEIRFVFGWHFPYHFSPAGRFVGHQYQNWFADSHQVCRYLAHNWQEIFPQVRAFAQLLGDTDAPEAFPRGWTAHLNTLIKCSWWAKNGDFGIWEGYGSCGFHTTDITYHGSWGLLALFPALQLRQMEMGAAFQREDGRVHHFFTPDFCAVDDGFDRVDMNPQFVLMVCRDYLWTGNQDYLAHMWPHVIKAMDNTALLDQDGDGLPDTGTGANTYDAWRFQGAPSYIAFLWLGALTAAVRLAQEMDDAHRAEQWSALLCKGQQSLRRLWNGSYFSLWVDKERRDECCMTDQLDGLWYTRLLGLPPFIEQQTAETTLNSILRWNFGREQGLINASYPPETHPTLYTYQNVQAMANWSGIEYAFASLLLEYGRFRQAAQVAQAVDERYWAAGRIFNHEECGEYYYRPLSSWTMLLSLSGLRLDKPTGRLTLRPAAEITRVPWFCPQAYGTLECKPGQWLLTCVAGQLDFTQLCCPGRRLLRMELAGNVVPFTQQADSAAAAATLRPGQSLMLEWE